MYWEWYALHAYMVVYKHTLARRPCTYIGDGKPIHCHKKALAETRLLFVSETLGTVHEHHNGIYNTYSIYSMA